MRALALVTRTLADAIDASRSPALRGLLDSLKRYGSLVGGLELAETWAIVRVHAPNRGITTSPLLALVLDVIATAPGLSTARDDVNAAAGGLPPIERGAAFEELLATLDATRRARRGVYATPPSLAGYLARAVDHATRELLGIQEGLSGVEQVLDPAAGSGALLLAAIEQIAASDGCLATFAEQRLAGVELQLAPLAAAHARIASALEERGAPLSPRARLAITLGNALDPATTDAGDGFSKALADEAELTRSLLAARASRVLLANPPWSGISANTSDAARALVAPYVRPDGGAPVAKRHWLNDDYVKFVRLAEVLASRSPRAVVGIITNHGLFDHPTFRALRASLLATFPDARFLDLHGSAKRRERDGASRDESAFGIQQGVGLSVLTRGGPARGVQRGDLRGSAAHKRHALDAVNTSIAFHAVVPEPPFFAFAARGCRQEERTFSLDEIFVERATGLVTARDALVIDADRPRLLARLAELADVTIPDEAIRARYFSSRTSPAYAKGDTRSFSLARARRHLATLEDPAAQLAPILHRPFDERWIFYDDALVDWSRRERLGHLAERATLALIAPRRAEIAAGFSHVFCARALAHHHSVSAKEVDHVFVLERACGASNIAGAFLEAVQTSAGLTTIRPRTAFDYVYALLHSAAYRARYTARLALEPAPVPTPRQGALLLRLAELGASLIATHTGESTPIGRLVWTSARDVVIRTPRVLDGRIVLAPDVAIEDVPPDVLAFTVGGRTPARAYLRERRGEPLTLEVVARYQRVLGGVAETLTTMRAIDRAVEEAGGFPGAFVAR